MKITKSELREFVKQLIDEMFDDEEILASEVENSTSNIAGYDAPWGAKIKRKMSKPEDDDEKDE